MDETGEIKKEKTRNLSTMTAIRFYLSFFKNHIPDVLWTLFLNILIIVPLQATPLLVKIIIDNCIPSEDIVSIIGILVIAITLFLFNILFIVSMRVTINTVIKSVSSDLRGALTRRLQILSLSYINQNSTGRFYSKIMRDVDKLERFANVFLNVVFRPLIIFIMIVAILIWVNPRLLGIFALIFPVYLVIFFIFKHLVRRSRHMERLAHETLSITVNNFLQTSLLSRQHGHEAFEAHKIDKSSEEVTNVSTKSAAYISLFQSFNMVITRIFNFGILCIAAISVIQGNLTIGGMLLFIQYFGQIMQIVQQFNNQYEVLSEFNESISSIKEVLDAPDIEYNHGKPKVEHIEGKVTFENVSFSYSDGKQVLNNISAEITPGMSVGLVGKSGSGKSTFVNLILGLYRPQSGTICIDDVPINDLDMRSVRKKIGVVNQQPIIFSGTVYDNIVHAYRNIPMKSVIEASKKANAYEFIVKLKDGFNAFIGENGVLLSGGQGQRLTIARTILRNPAILILDEATSAVDTESEILVQEALDNLMGSVTSFIIAHRLSTVRNADVIFVLDEGHIVEQGTHDELMELDNHYANLVNLQKNGTKDDMDD
jgi:ATP-binding cassette subfamily B protein